MVIAVGNTRVYWFPQSTITVKVYNDRAKIAVHPDKREFILWGNRVKLADLQEVYPERTPQEILTTIICNAMQSKFLQVDEEIV